MKFDFRILIIFLLVAVLFFSSGQMGCQQQKETEFDTIGLVTNFVQDAPPMELVTGITYPIYVDVNNLGGYDVPESSAHFYLSGIADNLQNVETYLQNSNFLDKKTEIQEGGQERLSFATEALPWKTFPAIFDLPIKLDSCYKYATITQTSVCIGKSSVVCLIEDEKINIGDNSAGPIQITSLTESIVGNKLYIKFLIENKGTGQVYLPTADCGKIQTDDIDEKLKENQVEIIIDAEQGFTCRLESTTKPYGSIDSLSGSTRVGQVTCQTIVPTETHLSPIKIVASYIYRETLTKNIQILPE